MKKIPFAPAILSLLASPFTLAQENNMGFIPRAAIGFSNYNFTQSPRPNLLPDGSDFPSVEFDVTFLMLGVGGTFFINNFYLDLYLQQSSDEKDQFEITTPLVFSEEFKGDRQDYAISAGIKLMEGQVGLYTGYKVGESEASGTQGTHLTFKEDGFFVGANYALPIAEAGVLSFNLAYAFLDGQLDETATPVFGPSFGIDAESDATGLSYGASWSGAINKQINYALGIDANHYEFDDVKNNGSTNPPNQFEEDFVTVKLSLSYRF